MNVIAIWIMQVDLQDGQAWYRVDRMDYAVFLQSGKKFGHFFGFEGEVLQSCVIA